MLLLMRCEPPRGLPWGGYLFIHSLEPTSCKGVGEVLDDGEHEQEQRHSHEDSQEPREQFSQILRRSCGNTKERQQVRK